MSLYLQVFVIFFLFNGTNFQSSPLKTTTYEHRPVTLQFPKKHDVDVIILKGDKIFYNVKWNDVNRILSVQGSTLNLTILSPVVNDSGIYSHNGFLVDLLVRKSPPPTELPASIKETDVSTLITIDLDLRITLIVLLILNIVVCICKLLFPFIRKCYKSHRLRQSNPNCSGDETVEIIDVEEIGSVDNQSAEQRIRNIENKLDNLNTRFSSLKNLCKSNKPSINDYQVEDVEDVDGTVGTI